MSERPLTVTFVIEVGQVWFVDAESWRVTQIGVHDVTLEKVHPDTCQITALDLVRRGDLEEISPRQIEDRALFAEHERLTAAGAELDRRHAASRDAPPRTDSPRR